MAGIAIIIRFIGCSGIPPFSHPSCLRAFIMEFPLLRPAKNPEPRPALQDFCMQVLASRCCLRRLIRARGWTGGGRDFSTDSLAERLFSCSPHSYGGCEAQI